MCSEFGLSGGSGPSSVVNQSGEFARVVNWIADACQDIDNKWEDWRYLWNRYTGTLSASESTPSAITQSGVIVRRWKTKSLKYRIANPLASTWSRVSYMDFQDFEDVIDPDTAIAGAPTYWTVMPDNSIQFDKPADQDYDLKGEFYRSPPVLANNNDTPLMPPDYHRIIIVRALMYYANREDAPELINASISEFPDILEKLESSQLDAFRWRRAANSDEARAVDHVRPGHWR